MVSLISFEQKCDSPGSADGCCALLLYPADQSSCPVARLPSLPTRASEFFERAQLEPADDLKISGQSLRRIRLRPHSTNADQRSARYLNRGQPFLGQVSRVTHTDVELQSIGGRHFFRDISRRENLNMGGKLNARASISVIRQVDYQANDSFYAPELVFGPNFNPIFSPLFVQHSYDASALPTTDFDIRALDALAHSQAVYDYFLENFSRNSWDNQGSSMGAVIESPFPPIDIPDECEGGIFARGSSLNAFFDSRTNEIFFTPVVPGQGLTSGLSASLDVTAHEWGHGFLDQESMLIYQGESGALNEAFADWTAVVVSDSVGRSDWQIGNDLLPPSNVASRGFIRDLSTFRKVNDDKWISVQCAPSLCNDFCGVHTNSGVPNHMFYLLSAGFESRANPSELLTGVTGIGLEKAYQIAFAANKDFWTSSTSFLAARAGMEMAARLLFTDQPEIEASVSTAWALVGVGALPSELPSVSAPVAPPPSPTTVAPPPSPVVEPAPPPVTIAPPPSPVVEPAPPPTTIAPPPSPVVEPAPPPVTIAPPPSPVVEPPPPTTVAPPPSPVVEPAPPPVTIAPPPPPSPVWPTETATEFPRDGPQFGLAQGQASPVFSVAYSSGEVNLIGFEQQCTRTDDDGACCALLLAETAAAVEDIRAANLTVVAVDPTSAFVGGLFESFSADNLYGRIYGDSNCRVASPVSTSRPLADTIASVTQAGEVHTHANVDVQSIGGRIFLQDISRRLSADQGGALGDDRSISARLVHDLSSESRFSNTKTTLYSYPVSGPVDAVIAARAVDALSYSQATYDFFSSNFAVNSWNEDGASMTAFVESPFPSSDISNPCTGEVYRRGSRYNAYYSNGGIHFSPLVDPDFTAALSAAADVVAHEWGHGYLDSAANLVYNREPGALNEAFADWTGIIVSRELGFTDWRIADDVPRISKPNVGFRDLSQPRSSGDASWRPVDRQSCASPHLCNDYCGVHYNSGVPNHMFYLLSDGGSATPATTTDMDAGMDADSDSDSDEVVISVTGIGVDKAFEIAYTANRNFWSSTTNFLAARAGMEMAARTLYPEDPTIERAVSLAWAAVGVGAIPPEPDTNPDTSPGTTSAASFK